MYNKIIKVTFAEKKVFMKKVMIQELIEVNNLVAKALYLQLRLNLNKLSDVWLKG